MKKDLLVPLALLLSVMTLPGCPASTSEGISPSPELTAVPTLPSDVSATPETAATPTPFQTPEPTPASEACGRRPCPPATPTPVVTPTPEVTPEPTAPPCLPQSSAPPDPPAPTACDPQDCDCDGQLDVDYSDKHYPDADGDGYGAGEDWSCHPETGLVSNNSDCNDQERTYYPGAPDPDGDGLDTSCDLQDGLAPSVGLETSGFTSIQDALDAAEAGQLVWVGPGTYLETELSMHGKALSVRAAAGATQTILDASAQGRLWRFDQGEDETSLLEGFSLKNGLAPDQGGAIWILGSSPTLRACIFEGNRVEGQGAHGGAVALQDSSAVLERILFRNNHAGSCTVELIQENTYEEYSDGTYTYSYAQTTSTCLPAVGGALSVQGGAPALLDAAFYENSAIGSGGAIAAEATSLTLSGTRAEANAATAACTLTSTSLYEIDTTPYGYSNESHNESMSCAKSARGGAIFSESATLDLQGTRMADNQAPSTCVSLYSYYAKWPCSMSIECGGSSTSDQCEVGEGGALYVSEGTLSARGDQYLGHQAGDGGTLFAKRAQVLLQDTRVHDAAATASRGSDSSANGSTGEYEASYMLGGRGGALYLEDATAMLAQVRLESSTASLLGGGVYANDSEVSLCALHLQDAQTLGLFSQTYSGHPDNYSGTFTEKPVGGSGGGVYAPTGAVRIEHSVFGGNHALQGGALYLGSYTHLAHVLLTDNVARGSSTHVKEYDPAGDLSDEAFVPYGGRGAGLFQAGGSITASHLVLANNEAQDMTVADAPTSPGLGGALYVSSDASAARATLTESILSHNRGTSLYVASGAADLQYSVLWAEAGQTATNLASLDPTVLTSDPDFLTLDAQNKPVNFHLASASPCIDQGNPALVDVDGSRADIGLYGGLQGDGFDQDADGVPDYFWPGTWLDAPSGVDPSLYDCDDANASIQSCF